MIFFSFDMLRFPGFGVFGCFGHLGLIALQQDLVSVCDYTSST